jgi:hypothetical protein
MLLSFGCELNQRGLKLDHRSRGFLSVEHRDHLGYPLGHDAAVLVALDGDRLEQIFVWLDHQFGTLSTR